MSKRENFVIENGVLKKYTGSGGEVQIPDGVVKIGRKVFWGKGIQHIIIPDSVTDIAYGAFYDTLIENIEIPDSVLRISANAFKDTDTLFYKPKTEVFAGKVLIRYAGKRVNYKIPNGTKAIGENAFRCPTLQSLSIPDTVTYIGPNAILDCNNLNEIVISEETVAKIGRSTIVAAFFKIPPKDKSDPWQKPASDFLLNCFIQDNMELSGLQNIFEKQINKEAVRESLAFYFIEMNLPKALGKLLAYQKNIPISELEKFLKLSQKGNRPEVNEILLNYQNLKYKGSETKKKDEEKNVKQVGRIGRSAAEWKKIFKVSYVEDGAVIGGYKGQEAIVEIPAYIGTRPVVEIKENAFMFTETITEVILPNTLKRIASGAFAYSNLKTITLRDGLLSIGEAVFEACPLSEIFIPASVTSIGEWTSLYKPEVLIHAPSGSYAETYAKENNIPFVAE